MTAILATNSSSDWDMTLGGSDTWNSDGGHWGIFAACDMASGVYSDYHAALCQWYCWMAFDGIRLRRDTALICAPAEVRNRSLARVTCFYRYRFFRRLVVAITPGGGRRSAGSAGIRERGPDADKNLGLIPAAKYIASSSPGFGGLAGVLWAHTPYVSRKRGLDDIGMRCCCGSAERTLVGG